MDLLNYVKYKVFAPKGLYLSGKEVEGCGLKKGEKVFKSPEASLIGRVYEESQGVDTMAGKSFKYNKNSSRTNTVQIFTKSPFTMKGEPTEKELNINNTENALLFFASADNETLLNFGDYVFDRLSTFRKDDLKSVKGLSNSAKNEYADIATYYNTLEENASFLMDQALASTENNLGEMYDMK